jgi:HlyD family type I secretion membrane fusion protein
MKLEITPVRSTYVAPSFGDHDREVMDPALRSRMRRPMLLGGTVIAALVVGLGAWASLSPLSSGITAPGEVRVEANRKTMRHAQTGTVRQILVKEGQLVRAGQTLMTFDDTDPRAAVDVLQNQYDALLAQSARFAAEVGNRAAVTYPAELTSRMSDPRVAGMIQDQNLLFSTRLQLFESQTSVLSQRLDQITNQIAGDQAQVDSVEEQRKLTLEELAGYQKLNAEGYAPKTLILRYQRSLADLGGRKGQLLADIARLKQQMGETRMNMSSLRDQRTSQAAEGLRDAQSKLADVQPRLTAAKGTLESTVLRSPVDGYVFNLTQFTIGGVVGAGEVLMDIVPSNSPMMVSASINPQDIDQVHVGMDARVRLVGQGARWRDPLPAKVAVVSADKIVSDKNTSAFYRVDLRIDPKDLKRLPRGERLTPGMPAQAMIVTGKRTIMGFLISPITDTFHHALREQ